jgi:hypothetical protein
VQEKVMYLFLLGDSLVGVTRPATRERLQVASLFHVARSNSKEVDNVKIC